MAIVNCLKKILTRWRVVKSIEGNPTVVDTNILIDYLRGKEEARVFLDWDCDPGDLYCSCITVFEIRCNIRPGEEAAVDGLLTRFRCVELNECSARLAAQWWMEYRRRGRTLDFKDLAIAVTAKRAKMRLATLNTQHFPMPSLDLFQPYVLLKDVEEK